MREPQKDYSENHRNLTSIYKQEGTGQYGATGRSGENGGRSRNPGTGIHHGPAGTPEINRRDHKSTGIDRHVQGGRPAWIDREITAEIC